MALEEPQSASEKAHEMAKGREGCERLRIGRFSSMRERIDDRSVK